MHPLLHLLSNMIVRKALVAITGVIMLLFVIGHLIGNLTVLSGPNAINAYAKLLQSLGPLLWMTRAFMLTVLIIHITFAVLVTLENWKSKFGRYAVTRKKTTTIAGETMIWSGAVLLVFIIFHILQFTLHITPDVVVQTDEQGRMDVFTMMQESFRLIPISAVYLISVGALFLHLLHGIQSVSQTVGLLNEKTKPFFNLAGLGLSALLLFGLGSIPLLMFTDILSIFLKFGGGAK